ncbi:MAG TPA: 16S rRNA (cytosine(967)-C(5))-methyltransferase RsmB [Terriglobales bacterium]|nr:16S rRNA (cytosine(967)-C(5))-methyltransferase RsmB [Terriglobales bacterium]
MDTGLLRASIWADMPAPARIAAFNILLRVEREQAYAVELLHSASMDKLSEADRNLTTEIVMGVLRWRLLLDQQIAQFSFTPFAKLDLEVVTALRMGAYQIMFLSRVPSHAAVNETVELVKQGRKTSAAGLANAVMRKILAQHKSGKRISNQRTPAEVFAHPDWLVQRWMQQFGSDVALKICDYDQQVPETVLRLSSATDDDTLCCENVELTSGVLMKNARRVIAGDVTRTSLFRDARVAIQDEGSQLVAALVGRGRRILDCCAAPGGKTAALATRFPEAEIVAAELHAHRARLLRRMAPQQNVQVLTADALQLPFAAEFERVLADVPCSGTGTLARNPEIKWRLKPIDIPDLHARQVSILRAAMKHATGGGRVIYSTCSLEPEENEDVVAECLEDNTDFHLIPVAEELDHLRNSGEVIWPDVATLVKGEFLRTIPGVHPCDGFFAAILERQ